MHSIKILNFKFRILLRSRSGQSLIEILVGLSIGAILIGGAGFGISFMLKSTTSSDDMQAASGIVRQTLDEVRSYASANWQNIYSLTKGLDTQYFLNASGTTFYTVQGKEGFLSKDVTDGLVGRWGFDEATGTIAYDMSGNGNDGTLTNSPTRATSVCWVGNCLIFNGINNYVEVSGFMGVTAFSNGSVSFWANFDRWSSVDNILGFQSAATNNNALRFEYDSGRLRVIFGNSGGSYSDAYSNNIISLNTWHHVVLTWNSSGNTATVYIDKDAKINTVTTWPTTYATFRVGSAYAGRFFQGYIDDVRIYNRVLTATEVKNLYESKPFSAYFSVENACRSNDSSSTITDTEPCQSGSIVDPITEEITATAEWNTRGVMDSISLTDYATRWKNDIFHQTDWSGGSGTDGPLTSPTTQYASSTNVDTTTNPGSVRIFGL
ncbi:MAG: LamG-like jellyroll fold domain-containing protein [Patescibacteria group bacterium]